MFLLSTGTLPYNWQYDAKAEILAEIELFYLLPHQRRWQAWFPEVIHYYADADEVQIEIKRLIKEGVTFDQKTNEYFLIMQYANGGDLQNYLKENFKKLTWDDKKKLALQIADGLNYLHKEDVLHRDLHSKNIVIHDEYEELYKKCWRQEPEQRPVISEVLNEFKRMNVGIELMKVSQNDEIQDDNELFISSV
ncbi:unnamed protein product [Rhizophagus irregularis]|nr:unnamed protein product [Rhizophagus irregularis]